ncbi:MAG: protein-glutamate O-methyltransferase CheR [Thermoanaerobacteraceae bacterium]|nr:protein-glutamate O-methyltransferase CheR [Thermoanaerobacteraceae bacterium]
MDDFLYFASSFYKISGINLNLYKEKQMKRRIDTFVNRHGCKTYIDFLNILNKDKEIYNEFLNYITINVTEFFRNPEQWDILKTNVIPLLSKDRKMLKIWSCACSSGEEVYSLQFILSNINVQYELLATDIDMEALNKAQSGVYDFRQIKNIDTRLLESYFTRLDNNKYKVKQDYKNNIKFDTFNLLTDIYPKGFDLILCRNVLIYLTEQAKNSVLTNLSSLLNRGGILFVGSTEQIIFPQNYGLETYKTFFYRKL